MYSNGVRLWKFRCHWKELPNSKIHCCSKSPEFSPKGAVWNESGQDLISNVLKASEVDLVVEFLSLNRLN